MIVSQCDNLPQTALYIVFYVHRRQGAIHDSYNGTVYKTFSDFHGFILKNPYPLFKIRRVTLLIKQS